MRFQEKDVSQDRAAAIEMIRLSGQMGVPVIAVGDEVIVGFDRQRLESALARQQRPALGAAVAAAESVARQRGLDLPAGAYVGRVAPGSPAARAGLREGDVILALNGQAVRCGEDIERVLSALGSGRPPVEIVWWRSGQELRGRVQL